jgi:hypothetical protein
MRENREFGGDKGYSFSVSEPGKELEYIKFFTEKAEGVPFQSYVVRGMQIKFRDSRLHSVGYTETHDHVHFAPEPGETIERMSVKTGSLVDRVEIHTSKNHIISAGGDGGWPHDFDVGNGKITRIHGAQGVNIDRIGVDFEE